MSVEYIGIDPGLDGAVGKIRLDGTVRVHGTPTLVISGKTGDRRAYDLPGMRALLGLCLGAHVALERVHAMPKQGTRSTFTFGYGLGLWEGLLVGLGLSYEYVTPQRWQKVLLDGQGKGKDAARVVAMRLFPQVAVQLKRKKDHGRADALLIAEWLRRTRAG